MKAIKKKLRSLLKFNEINLTSGEIASNSKIQNSRITGEIKIANHAIINDSTMSGKIRIGSNAQIDSAKLSGQIELGDNVRLIDGTSLNGKISIGRNTSINGPNTDLTSAINQIEIGNFCSIARNVTFQEFNHDFSKMTSYFIHRNLINDGVRNDIISKGNIRLGNDVWVGTHCVILSGVTIGTGAVIAANSVVLSDIPPYAIAAGSPAKILKFRFQPNVIAQLLASNWWELPKDELINFYHRFDPESGFKKEAI